MNLYNYNNETNELEVTKTEAKSLAAVTRKIEIGDEADKFISSYLPTIDPEQVAADAWYEQHLLVQSLNVDEERKVRTFTDKSVEDQTETPLNAYDVALAKRAELENSNSWLKGLRGLRAPERPEFIVDVDEWKSVNIHYRDSRWREFSKQIDGGSFIFSVGDTLGILIETVQVLLDEKPIRGDVSKFIELKQGMEDLRLKFPKN